MVLALLGTLGNLDSNLGGHKGFGTRGGTRSFDRDLGQFWRGRTSGLDVSMVAAGHEETRAVFLGGGEWRCRLVDFCNNKFVNLGGDKK